MFWQCSKCDKILEENKKLKEENKKLKEDNKELRDANHNLVLIANKSWHDHCYDEEKYKQYQQDNIDLMNKVSKLNAELYDFKKQAMNSQE